MEWGSIRRNGFRIVSEQFGGCLFIRNTYTLMTRGQKGCYVYCTDQELADYLKSGLTKVEAQRKEVVGLLVAEPKASYGGEN